MHFIDYMYIKEKKIRFGSNCLEEFSDDNLNAAHVQF